MKNLIVGVIIGVLLNGLVVFAAEKIVVNPLVLVAKSSVKRVDTKVYTTKVNTPEGSYRIFTARGYRSLGITAIKIN